MVAVVAGQHDDAHAVRAQAVERRRRRRLDRIGDGDDAGRLAVDGDEQHRRAVAAAARRRVPREIADATPRSSISFALPSATARPPTVPVTPLPVTDAKSVASCRAHAALLRRGDDRRGQRMFARPFEAGGQRQQIVPRRSRAAGTTAIDARLALGQRAGLVDDQRIDLLQALERFGDS